MVTLSTTFGHPAVPSNSNGPLLKIDNNGQLIHLVCPCLKAHKLVNYLHLEGIHNTVIKNCATA